MKNQAYNHILSPLILAGVALKNRLGFAPINTGLLGSESRTDNKCIEFYRQYCQSGIALINIGGVAVSGSGRANAHSLALDSKKNAGCLRGIISEAQRNNTKIIIQLEHAGRQSWPNEIGHQLVAPSPIPCPVVNIIPRELTVKEIRSIVKGFKKSAIICEDIGANFVEIHAAHGYLLSSFISPATNKRSDQYGGNILNRFRIIYEIVYEISSSCQVPIGIRINCTDNIKDGITISDICEGLEFLKGKISYVSISGGMYSKKGDVIIPGINQGEALWKTLSGKIRNCSSIPTMIAGNITSMSTANSLLKDGYTDMVLMGRSLLADPDLLHKTINNNSNDIEKCTYCDKCKYHSRGKSYIECPLNPVLSNTFTEQTH